MDIYNRKELLHYVLEDVLIQYIDDVCDQFLLLLKNSFIEDSNVEEVFSELADQQDLTGILGDTVRISGKQY